MIILQELPINILFVRRMLKLNVTVDEIGKEACISFPALSYQDFDRTGWNFFIMFECHPVTGM